MYIIYTAYIQIRKGISTTNVLFIAIYNIFIRYKFNDKFWYIMITIIKQ